MADAGLADRVVGGDRRALAQAITLVESTRPDHREEARELLDELLPRTGGARRVGISGAPGAGKSSLIEALGLHAVGAGHQVAVLAVDPSSNRSGGSILGDKTRMSDLGRHPEAYIRPSPSGGTLGGVARRTREALLVCEAAGFDVVLVETVGVGQSEVAVADLVDLFVLVAAPGGGDELQGIKRGIMELADVVVVNKADGDLLPAAQRAVSDIRSAVHLLRPKRPGWEVSVEPVSSVEGTGIVELWDLVVRSIDSLRTSGALDELRAGQAVDWMWQEIRTTLLRALRDAPELATATADTEAAVRSGSMSSTAGALHLLAELRRTAPEGR